jgi:murein DD-endopeptidase MepM/ murein hydrolase activator NlpD
MESWKLIGILAAIAGVGVASAAEKPVPAQAKAAPEKSVVIVQGEVGRWPGVVAKSCSMSGKRYAPVAHVCYFPVDIAAAPGKRSISVTDDKGVAHKGWAFIEAADWPSLDITLPDDTYINITAANLKRHDAERRRVLALFKRPIGEPRFTIPLGKPADPLPHNENDFGSLRKFNGVRSSQHSGRDYPVSVGSPIKAVADGTVILAEDQFFTGNSVFVDHGGGLISMNFHLSEIDVKVGAQVKRGQTIGKVGSTGRATGPHLHLGMRWGAARIDPQPLMESPGKLPEVGDTPTEIKVKQKRVRSEPAEPTVIDEG